MVLTVGGLFAFFTCLYFAYDQGVKSGHDGYADDQNALAQLRSELAELKLGADKSQEALILAQRQQQIQEEAYKQMSLAYANSEQKNAVLGSRLDFYRSIISPEDGETGPSIQALEHDFSPGQLSFNITLVQAIRHKEQVRGNLVVTLFENEEAIGRWPTNSPRSVSYQYFQQVSGTIDRTSLADNAKLKVELELQGGEKLERWFQVGASGQDSDNAETGTVSDTNSTG